MEEGRVNEQLEIASGFGLAMEQEGGETLMRGGRLAGVNQVVTCLGRRKHGGGQLQHQQEQRGGPQGCGRSR